MVAAPSHPHVSSPPAVTDTVNLSYRGLTCFLLVQLAEQCSLDQTTRTLKLGFNDLRDDGSTFIANLLRVNNTLTCLDLGFCSIGDVGVESLAASLMVNHTLKILYLSGNLLTGSGFKSLGNALMANKGLEALYLTGNAGQSEGAKHIAYGLRYNRTIQQLFINGNKIGPDGASSLSDALSVNHALTHVNLSDNSIGDDGLHSLSEAMAHQKELKYLELSFNKITAVGIATFVGSLINYRSLARLLLDNNKLSCQGAKALAVALPHMSLQELNVAFNGINAEGIFAIVHNVSLSPSLTVLSLCGNCIDDNVSGALANMLAVNSVLCSLYLDHTGLSAHAEKMIANGIARNKHLALQVLTGMGLGRALVQLGSPAECESMANDQALRYLTQVWACYEQRQQGSPCMSHSSSSSQATSSGGVEPNSNSPPSSPPRPVDVPDGTVRAVVIAARELRSAPFNTQDLCELRNHFFKPPRMGTEMLNEVEDTDGGDAEDVHAKKDRHHHERPREVAREVRPKKRPTNSNTVSRIAFYPLVKQRLEAGGATISDSDVLTLLRQLMLLENTLPGWEPPVLERILLQEVLAPSTQ